MTTETKFYRTSYAPAFRRIEEGPQSEIDYKDQERGEEFAVIFSRFVNTMSGDEACAYAIDKMSRDHRTLQQGITRFCVGWLEHLAEKGVSPSTCDLRNEASMKLAQQFVQNIRVEDRSLPNV